MCVCMRVCARACARARVCMPACACMRACVCMVLVCGRMSDSHGIKGQTTVCIDAKVVEN